MMLSRATFSLAIVEVILLFFHGALCIILFIACLVLTLVIRSSDSSFDGDATDFGPPSLTRYSGGGYSTYTPASASTYSFGNTLTGRNAVETSRALHAPSKEADERLRRDDTHFEAVVNGVSDVLPTPAFSPVRARRPTAISLAPWPPAEQKLERASSPAALEPSRRALRSILARASSDPDDVPIPPYALVVSLLVFLLLGVLATVTQFGTDIATAALCRSKAKSPLVEQLRSTKVVMWITIVDQIIIFVTGLLVVIFLAVDGVFSAATSDSVRITPILFLVFLALWAVTSIIGFARLFTLVRDYRRLKRTPPSEDPANQSRFDMVQGYYAASHMVPTQNAYQAEYRGQYPQQQATYEQNRNREQAPVDISHAPGHGLETRAADVGQPENPATHEEYPAESSRRNGL